MSKKGKKNRLISILCLGVFVASVGLATGVSIKMFSLYSQNQKLLKIKNDMLEEQAYQKSINDNLANDDYLNVYYDETYSSYTMDDVLVIINK